MAYHLAMFVENKPGKLERITKILADNSINVRAVSVASGGEFGIVKLLADKPEQAFEALKAQHITVSKRTIIMVLVDDKPGMLHKALVTLSSNNINVEDCYGFVTENKKTAAIVMEVEKISEAQRVLEKQGFKTLGDNEIYSV